MLFDQNIKTPSHEKIVLSHGMAFVDATVPDGVFVRVTAQRLDENDAIRLAAFLNRFFRERHQAEVRAEADRVKANRAAKAKRYEDKRAIPK